MAELFELNNKNQVVPSPEALLIPEFREIWISDKTRHKEQAMKEFKYLYFVASFKSDYRRTFNKTDIPRAVSEQVLLDKNYYKKIPQRVENALGAFNGLQNVKSLQAFEVSEHLLEQTLEYLKTLTKDDIAANYKTIYEIQAKLPGLIQQYEKYRKLVEMEIDESAKTTKENHKLGDRENPQFKEY